MYRKDSNLPRHRWLARKRRSPDRQPTRCKPMAQAVTTDVSSDHNPITDNEFLDFVIALNDGDFHLPDLS